MQETAPETEPDTGLAGDAARAASETADRAAELTEGLPPEVWAGVGLGAFVILAALVIVWRIGAGEKHRTALRSGLRRARMPVMLAAIAIAGALAMPAIDLPGELDDLAATAVRVITVIALGWAVGTVGDAILKRWTSRLDLSASDNLKARSRATQLNVMRRIWVFAVAFVVLALALLTIPGLRNVGVSLFASAGVAGIVIGVAAQPVLSNLVAGLQIAFSQPIRIEDAVVVEGEWGWIEEIGLFHVVIRIWDWRRLVVPLTYFSSTPFQNWTKTRASILGSIFWRVDYRAPIEEMRKKLDEILETTDLWDRQAKVLQVTDSDGTTLEIRALASASTSPRAWDLRCYVREQMIGWLQREHPYALPRARELSDETQREGEPLDWAHPPPPRPAPRTPEEPVRDESLQEGPEVEAAEADSSARADRSEADLASDRKRRGKGPRA
ncbi:MAG: mechanosensitive ion channel family protein [Oceanicaulis sp.]